MAYISLDDWKKQNGREASTPSANSSMQTGTQSAGYIPLQTWKEQGQPLYQQRISQQKKTNDNPLRVLARNYNEEPTITEIVDQFSSNARNAVRSGSYNTREWTGQYDKLMKYLDDYGSQMNGTEVAMLKSKLKNVYDTINPAKAQIQAFPTKENTFRAGGKDITTYDTSPISLNRNILNGTDVEEDKVPEEWWKSPTPAGLSVSDKTDKKVSAGTANAALNTNFGRNLRLADQKMNNEKRLRDTAYYQSIGAPLDSYSNSDLESLQKLYDNMITSRYQDLGNGLYKDTQASSTQYAPDQAMAVGGPGKDDGEDFWTKFYRIQREHPEFTEDQIYDYIENEPREDYTVQQRPDYASWFRGANNNIGTELERRSFLREYAPYYLETDFNDKNGYNEQFGWQGEIPELSTQTATGVLGGRFNEDEYDRLFYESVNGNQAATDLLTKVINPDTGDIMEYEYDQQSFMNDGKAKGVLAQSLNDDEIGMFNYLYSTQGKEAAMEYYNGLLPALNQRWTTARNEELEELMKDPGLALLYNAATTLTKPITAIASVANQVYDLAKNGKIDAYDPKYFNLNGANLVRAATSKAIDNDVLSFLYEGAMSTIDNVYGMAIGGAISKVFGLTGQLANTATEGVVLGLMTTDAAQSSVLNNLQAGMDTVDAIVNGLMSGAVEFITEKIGLDNFFNSMWYGEKKWTSLMKQILSEGGEEVLGNTMDDAWGLLYDRLTDKSTSDWRREMNAYILENGLAPEDEMTAFNAVFGQHALEAAKAGAMGAFSGGLLGGAGMARSAIDLNNNVRSNMLDVHIDPRDTDTIRALVEEGLTYDKKSKAYKKAAQMQTMLDSGKVSMGILPDNMADELYEELVRADITSGSGAPRQTAFGTDFVDYIASGYEDSGRTEGARVMRAFNPFNGSDPDVSPADYAKEINAVYTAAAEGKTIPPYSLISENAARAAINAAKSDNIKLQIQTQEEAEDIANATPEPETWTEPATNEAQEVNAPEEYEPIQKTNDKIGRDYEKVLDYVDELSAEGQDEFANVMESNYADDMDVSAYLDGARAIADAAQNGTALEDVQIPAKAQKFISDSVKAAMYNAASPDNAQQNKKPVQSAIPMTPKQPKLTSEQEAQRNQDQVFVDSVVRDAIAENPDMDPGEVRRRITAFAMADNAVEDVEEAEELREKGYDIPESRGSVYGMTRAELEENDEILYSMLSPETLDKLRDVSSRGLLFGAQQIENKEGAINGETEGEVPVPGVGKWNDGQGTGIKVRTVETGAGQTAETGSGRQQAVSPEGRNGFRLTGRKVTAQSLGIRNGSASSEVEIVELEDTPENRQIRQLSEKYNVKVVAYAGGNLSMDDGTEARGLYDGGTIYVRMDDPTFSGQSIVKHETGHRLLETNKTAKIRTVFRALESKFGQGFVEDRLMPAYREALAGTDYTDDEIREEIVCDIFGEMNVQEEVLRNLPAISDLYDRFMEEGGKISQTVLENQDETAEAVEDVKDNGPPKRSTVTTTAVDSDGRNITPAQQEYFKDSKVRDNNGNLKVMYHGTTEQFTVFDKNKAKRSGTLGNGFYFTDSLSHSGTYGEPMAVYLNITNPLQAGTRNITESQLRTFVQELADNEDYGIENYGSDATVDSIVRSLKGKDDFAIIRDLNLTCVGNMREALELFNEVNGTNYDGIITDIETLVFESSQVKSVNNENPTNDQDIRFSRSSGNPTIATKTQESVGKDLRKRVNELETENKRLRRDREYFKGQTKLSALTPGSAAWHSLKPLISEYAAKKILRAVQDFYGSTEDVTKYVGDVQRLVTLLATRTDGNTFDDVNRMILPIAKAIVENTQMIIDDDGSQILKDIRTTTLKVSAKARADITDFEDFRKAHFGKMRISYNSGTDVTEFYMQMTEKWGESLFPSDIMNASDQLLYIAEFVDNYQPITQNPYSYDMAALVQDAAFSLYNEMLNADLFEPTYADRQNARIQKLQEESQQRVQQVREAARQQRDDQVKKVKEHYKEVAERRRARKQDSDARKALLKVAKRLSNMKTTRANKALISSLIGDLDLVAISLTDGKAESLAQLNAWYEEQKSTNPEFVARHDLIGKQLARLSQKHISDMTLDDVLELTNALKVLENTIRNDKKLIDVQDSRDTLQMGYQVIRDIDNAMGTRKGALRTIDNVMIKGTLSPTRFMHRLTGYVESDPLYQAVAGEQGLASGQRRMLDYQMRAGKLFTEWLSDKKFMKRLTGTKAEILTYDIITADGKNETIQITPDMRMLLYLASKDQGWMRHMCGYDTEGGHIAGGGITLPDMKSYRKGNLTDAYSGGTKTVKLTRSFLTRLAADMSTQEREFADAIHDYFNGMSKDEINAVSEQLLGRAIAEVGDYLPISVDKNFLGAEYGALKMDGTIEGMGNLKERINSNKPVMVRDLTSVLKQSIESTSKYVGLAIPIRNFNKLMGVTVGHVDENGVYQNYENSVLKTINDKWGESAQKYIENMITDLQMPSRNQEELEKAFSKIRSNYAGAVLTLNFSVALKQAASYPTAAAVLGWGPLMKAFKNFGHVDLEFISKWTPLQWYRTQGFSTQELGDIQNQNNFFSNLPKGLNWIQGVDLLTTRKLWKAAEYYVRDNNPDLYSKGAGERGQSDAFYRAVAEIYNKAIEETQPNYTALQRPEYLRSKSGIVRTLMMFKTQPFQNFNILYDAVNDFRGKRAQLVNDSDNMEIRAQYEEAGKNLRRAITSQIAQLIVFASMTMAWNIFRRKKEKYTDEDGNISLETIGTNIGKDALSGLFSIMPFGSDVWSFAASKIFGDKYYGFESMTDSAISDFITGVGDIWKLFDGSLDDGTPWFTGYKKKMKSIASAITKMTGIPFDNVYNTITALYMRGRDGLDLINGTHMGDYYAALWTEDPSKDKTEFYNILYDAYDKGYLEDYEAIRADMIESGEWLGDEDKTPEEEIDEGVQKVYIKKTTGGSTKKQGVYDYLYSIKDTDEYQAEYDRALQFGFDEDDISEGMRKSLAAELIGIPSSKLNNSDLYGYLYDQYGTAEYKTNYQKLTDNGFTEKEISDGMKKAFGVSVTGKDPDDYKSADLYDYLYDLKKTSTSEYNSTIRKMEDLGFNSDTIDGGVKAAYGRQLTGLEGDDYSVTALYDHLYNLKKRSASSYNTEVKNMKAAGFTEDAINGGMRDAYGRAVTGKTDDYSSEDLYTYVYKNKKSNLSAAIKEMQDYGFSESSIKTGLKDAYGSQLTGIAYDDVRVDDVYDYVYNLYSTNSNKFSVEYQNMINVGFTESAIKEGIEKRLKAAYGVDNVKKLPFRFSAPDHTLPSWWTYKTEDKDTGPLKESGTATGSSWIGNYSYNNGALTIYENGVPYTYNGVPEEVYENFKNASSKGSFVNSYIKGKYTRS